MFQTFRLKWSMENGAWGTRKKVRSVFVDECRVAQTR